MQQLRVLLSLGSNLGDRLKYLQAATNALKQFPNSHITAISAVYESPPWGIDETPAYLNAVLLLVVDTSAFNIDNIDNIADDIINSTVNSTIIINNIKEILNELLLYCQLIEKKYHRVRVEHKQYAARTLDIDILYAELSNNYYKDDDSQLKKVITNNQYLDMLIIHSKNLTIPHARFAIRAFALKPALDIWYSQTSRNKLLNWYNKPNIQIDEKKVIKTKYIIYL